MATVSKDDFAHVDLANLAGQLADDGVAFDNPDLASDAELNQEIAAALHDGDGIAVVDQGDNSVGWARDVAQQLQDASGLSTVIVQRPSGLSAVSDSFSRAELEAAQAHVQPGEPQLVALQEFYSALSDPGLTPPWTLLAPIVVGVCLLVGWAAWRKEVRNQTMSQG